MTFLRTISMAALATTALTSAASAQARFDNAGEIAPGTYWQYGTAVSGNGMYVAGYGFSGGYHAFLMDEDGTINLGQHNGDDTFAYAVSNTGVVVGNSQGPGTTSAWRWSGDGGFEDLGRLEMLNGGNTFATGISNDGTRIVGHSFRPSVGFYEAFIFVDGASGGVFGNDQMFGLGTLSATGGSAANGMSGNGLWAAGQSGNAAGEGRAVRWSLADYQNAASTIQDLGTLGGNYSTGMDVSNDGRVVVGSAGNAAGEMRAFRWVEGATGGAAGNVEMYDLGTLGGNESWANAVSGDGAVAVGYAFDDTGYDHAFRWTEGAGMVRVADWLAANGVDVGTTRLYDASGVSDDGNVIVGQAVPDNGAPRAYIARVTPDQGGGGSGIMDVAEYTHSLLANARAAQMGVDLTWMPLNGAHHRPLMMQGRMEDDTCLWSVSDLAYKANTDTGIALTEVGACGALGDGLVAGLGVGASTSWQGLALGGNAQLAGAYVMGEVDWNPDGTPLLLSLTGVLGGWQANINRAYTNGAATDMSSGSTGITAGVIRARVDWMDAAVLGNVSINPWISGAIGHTQMGGYTESGGAFPARFDAQSLVQGEVRAGVTAKAEITPETTLSGTLEVAHRSGGAPGSSGQVLGLFDFDLGGGNQGSTWARAGLDLDHAITEDVRLSGSVHVATQGQDATVSGSLGLRATF